MGFTLNNHVNNGMTSKRSLAKRLDGEPTRSSILGQSKCDDQCGHLVVGLKWCMDVEHCRGFY